MKRIIKTVGFVVLYMSVYLFFQVFFSLLIGIGAGIKALLENGEMTNPNIIAQEIQLTVSHLSLSIILLSIIFSLPLYYLICKLRNKNIFKICNFREISFKNVCMTAVIGASISVLLSAILSFIPVKEIFPEYEDVISSLLAGKNIFTVLFVTGIAVPLMEELIFRGLILSELRKIVSVKWAVIIQGILFGLYHFNTLQIIYAAILGIAFGIVLVWTKSIWSSVILHASVNNASTLTGNYMTTDVILSYRYVFIITCLLIIVLLSFQISKKSELDWNI